MAGPKGRKRSAADAAATDVGPGGPEQRSSPATVARTAAAEAVRRAPEPTSIEIDGKQCLHEVRWAAPVL